MPRYKAILAYDGSSFRGWHRQPDQPSVQAALEVVLSQLHKAPSRVVGSGRTDAGVHAAGQVIHFDSPIHLTSDQWVKAWGSNLPKTIKVLHCEPVVDTFHARFTAISRLYHYYLKPEFTLMPWQAPYCWGTHRTVQDFDRLQAMAKTLLGTHDFTTFAAARDPNPTKVRTITKAQFVPWQEGLCFQIEGSSFLWNQVRSLVGTLFEFDRTHKSTDQFQSLLEKPDRPKVGQTAPPWRLFPESVSYPL